MKDKKLPSQTPKPFDNSSFSVDELTIESQEDQVSLYGNLDISKDKVGLDKINTLVAYLTAVKASLDVLNSASQLPDVETIKPPVMKANPMG